MTRITSSGASDTDSARNRVSGWSACTAWITASPVPLGRWTSSSTTSGFVSLMRTTASAMSAASPTTSSRPPISLRTPDRTREWSSMSRTLGFLIWVSPSHGRLCREREGEPDLGPGPAARLDRRPATVTFHARDQRLAHPVAVLRDRGQLESLAAVADVDGELTRADLDIDGEGAQPRVLGSVDRCLARGLHDRVDLRSDGQVTDDDEIDGDVVLVLYFGTRGGDHRAKRCRRLCGSIQPAAELAIGVPGEAPHLVGGVGMALDQRQGLQHGVVNPTGELDALVLADSGGALLGCLTPIAQQPGPDGNHDAERGG